MARTLDQIRAHIRAVAANPAISTTLIQTEDLLALCDASEKPDDDAIREAVRNAIRDFSSPTVGRGDVHGGQTGYILYERDGVPFVAEAVVRAVSSSARSPKEG